MCLCDVCDVCDGLLLVVACSNINKYHFLYSNRSPPVSGTICLPSVYGSVAQVARRGAQMVEHQPIQTEELCGQSNIELCELSDLHRGAEGNR